ncbi:transcription factor Adf-1-like [Siphateles boraxobius]|uniref:transcription factor Adf-1-like n=1 Tax=Siphateles boraxobius TaxID=180520 RepID=UPI0040649E10
MEEKLILAVSGQPELFDSSSYFYRDRNKKDLAWKKISEEIVQPDDVCRKKWKSLRDTYLKEKRKEMEKRSGSAAGSGKRWKFSQILGFLDEKRQDNHLEDQGHPEQSGETVTEPYQSEDGQRTPSSAPVSPVPGPSAPAAEPRGQQRRRARCSGWTSMRRRYILHCEERMPKAFSTTSLALERR